MKFRGIALSASVVTLATLSVQASELPERWLGTYTSTQNNLVSLKRVEITEKKDGTPKVKAWLVGFPEEVFLGEAHPVPYFDRSDRNNSNTLFISLPSEKYHPTLILSPQIGNAKSIETLVFQCYMTDVDGTKIHFDGNLSRTK